MTQNYLGIRNGVVVCVQHVDQHEFSGEFHHAYDRDPVPFSSEVELLIRLDEFFDSLKFPFSATSSRNFIRHANTPTDMITEEDRVMEDKDILMNHGEVGTFIIRVQQRQNSSWQGRITWVEKNQTLYFRSVWEMMKLIENAISTVAPDENEGPDPVWETMSEPS